MLASHVDPEQLMGPTGDRAAIGKQQPEAWTGGADLSVHADNQPSNFLITSLHNLPVHASYAPLACVESWR